jgi:hypothetical protein
MANLNKASGSINGKRRAVVYGYFENDAPGSAQTPLNAYGIQKRRADTFSPTARQYTKCQDLAFLAEVESQGKSGRHLVYPSDVAEKSCDVHYLRDRPRVPWIFREAGAVQHRHRAGHDFGQRLETAAHRPARWCAIETVTSGGRR